MNRFSFFTLLLVFCVFQTFSANAQTSTLTFKVESLKSEKETQELKNLLVSHYSEKIVSADVQFKKGAIVIAGNANFNAQEILEFFRYQGYEAYYEEFGMIKKLSQDGKFIEVKRINEE